MPPPPLPPDGAIDPAPEVIPLTWGCVGVGKGGFCPTLALRGAGLGADIPLVRLKLAHIAPSKWKHRTVYLLWMRIDYEIKSKMEFADMASCRMQASKSVSSMCGTSYCLNDTIEGNGYSQLGLGGHSDFCSIDLPDIATITVLIRPPSGDRVRTSDLTTLQNQASPPEMTQTRVFLAKPIPAPSLHYVAARRR
jgi:hypothetical protein